MWALYFVAKCLALYVYYQVLHVMGLGIRFKLLTFLFVTPYVKFHKLHNQCKTDRDRKAFLCSVVVDSIWALMYFGYFVFVPRHMYWFFIMVLVVYNIAAEYVQYLITRNPEDTYEVKLSKSPMDYLLAPTVALVFAVSAPWLNFDKFRFGEHQHSSFAWFVFLLLQADVFFGVFHVMHHKIPSLWVKHAIHHQYRREDLNSLANFYAELGDSFSMAFGIFFMGNVLSAVGDQSFLSMFDLAMAAAFTHHKYTNEHMTLSMFWEFDAIDICLDKPRISCYHNAHHHSYLSKFSLFGLVSDDVLTTLTVSLGLVPKSQPSEPFEATKNLSAEEAKESFPLKSD